MLIRNFRVVLYSGVLSLGVLVGAFLDQLTLSQPGGQIIRPPPKKNYYWHLWIFDFPMALVSVKQDALKNSMSLLLPFFIDILVIVC